MQYINNQVDRNNIGGHDEGNWAKYEEKTKSE